MGWGYSQHCPGKRQGSEAAPTGSNLGSYGGAGSTLTSTPPLDKAPMLDRYEHLKGKQYPGLYQLWVCEEWEHSWPKSQGVRKKAASTNPPSTHQWCNNHLSVGIAISLLVQGYWLQTLVLEKSHCFKKTQANKPSKQDRTQLQFYQQTAAVCLLSPSLKYL